jgi:hypothetical protein
MSFSFTVKLNAMLSGVNYFEKEKWSLHWRKKDVILVKNGSL